MKLIDKLTEIYDRYAPPPEPGNIWGKEENLELTDNLYVPARDRRSAKCRYLGVRCRRLVYEMMGVDYNDLELTYLALQELDNMASSCEERFSTIEGLFIEFLGKDVDRLDLEKLNNAIEANLIYKHPELKIKDPFNNRVLFVWDIVWGLLSVYNELDPAVDSSDSTARNLFFENVERRLHKIERMRYNVSARFESDRLPSSGSGQDGHTLRLFEYPITETNIPGHFWIHPLTIGREFLSQTDFILSPTGKQDPISAIETMFRPDSPLGWVNIEARTYNLCDKVIHILHLEELLGHLSRIYTEGRAQSIMIAMANSSYSRRISIISPHSWKGVIGSGKPRDDGTFKDPYFESIDIRLDALIPGDHIIQRNHPAYVGLTRDPWRLENSLITRIDGISIPSCIEVQGHGAGPSPFGIMQAELVMRFQKLLRKAQQKVDLRFPEHDNPPDLSTPEGLRAALKAAFGSEDPFGTYIIDGVEFPCTMLEIALVAHGDGLQQSDGNQAIPYRYNKSTAQNIGDNFGGVLEFRNEYVQREQGAFWTRWIFKSPNPDAKPLTIERNSEFAEDLVAYPTASNMPYVEKIELDIDSRMLKLIGLFFSSEKITDIYFVSDPRRKYTYSVNVWTHQGTGTLLIQNGNLEINASDFEIVSEKEINVVLPPTWNPPKNFWSPILRTIIGVEIRAETSFLWPIHPGEDVQIREGDDFNVGYYPLFSCSNPESSTPVFNLRVGFDITDHTNWVQKFYNEHAPEQTIRVIRPRLKDLPEGI